MKPRLTICALATALLSPAFGCSGDTVASTGLDLVIRASFQPLPAQITAGAGALAPELTDLGRMLFHEPRLSKSHRVSCSSCHPLDAYGVDGQSVSTGHAGKTGERNAPTVYNAAGHLAQFWDGREPDVEAQAKGPILNPIEMAMPDAAFVEKTLKSIPGYVAAFGRAFPGDADPVTFDHVATAIGAFERKLVTPSRWDRYLEGDQAALSDEEQAGLATFVEVGCIVCHSGTYVGGQIYNRLGLMKPWPGNEDVGRAGVTGNQAEKFFFKVPSLRNVHKTAPYLHDGSIEDLETMVRLMAEYQLGKQLSAEQTGSILTFLEALTGELPSGYIEAPELPPGGPTTPEPDDK